jgi:hypothetical protein
MAERSDKRHAADMGIRRRLYTIPRGNSTRWPASPGITTSAGATKRHLNRATNFQIVTLVEPLKAIPRQHNFNRL